MRSGVYMDSPKLLGNNLTAEMIGLKHNTLAVWRSQGKGPIYLKIGRKVLYKEADVMAWLEQQKWVSTMHQINQSK